MKLALQMFPLLTVLQLDATVLDGIYTTFHFNHGFLGCRSKGCNISIYKNFKDSKAIYIKACYIQRSRSPITDLDLPKKKKSGLRNDQFLRPRTEEHLPFLPIKFLLHTSILLVDFKSTAVPWLWLAHGLFPQLEGSQEKEKSKLQKIERRLSDCLNRQVRKIKIKVAELNKAILDVPYNQFKNSSHINYCTRTWNNSLHWQWQLCSSLCSLFLQSIRQQLRPKYPISP